MQKTYAFFTDPSGKCVLGDVVVADEAEAHLLAIEWNHKHFAGDPRCTQKIIKVMVYKKAPFALISHKPVQERQ